MAISTYLYPVFFNQIPYLRGCSRVSGTCIFFFMLALYSHCSLNVLYKNCLVKNRHTDAHTRRKGRIKSADRGTLFLGEIDELPTALQVKLLRFLQERCIEQI